MPTLNWIGKEAVVNHHLEVPFHLLRCDPNLSAGDPESGNLLIEGDNLQALKALLPYYAKQVKLIYIDPPYNTGNENWIYNDNVNSPEIRRWLGKVVGKEAEDLNRHDKWLCMMYPRLVLAEKFLSPDGVIFVSIDDNEVHFLRTLLDEIFDRKNLLANFIWQTEGNFDNQAKVKFAHEYILAYTKNQALFPAPSIIDPNIPEDSKLYRKQIRNTIVKNGPKNPISSILLPVGFPADFKEGIIPARTNAWPHYDEDVIVADFTVQKAVFAKSGWSSKRIFENFIDTGFKSVIDTKGQNATFVLTKTGAIETIKTRSKMQSHVISVLQNMGSTQQMSAELNTAGIKFDYPKPTKLLNYFISMIHDKKFIVLDFFAGSGTTGQAVLQQNNEDNGNRSFILVEIEKNILLNVTKPRLEGVEELGGFRYCTLGETLFNADGQLRQKEVSFADLARHIFFTETGVPLSKDRPGNSPLIGIHNNTAIYLLYNGIIDDVHPDTGNVLTRALLASLPPHNGPKIIYGNGCRLSLDYLQSQNITFRQTPYEIKIA